MLSSYPKKAKAIRWHDLGDLRLDTIDVPKLKDGQVLVRNLYAGICGSDRHSWHFGTFMDKTSSLNYPAILGHEGSGEIIAIGKNVECDAVGQPIKEGDMVAYHDVLGCGKCMFCRQGAGNVCKDVKVAGMKPGNFVEYYTYPVSQIIKVEGVNPRHAALIEPASVVVHGNRLVDKNILGNTVLILGAGPIGLFRTQFVKNEGATNVIVTEVEEMKRKIAQELGADIVVDPRKENVVKLVEDVTSGYGADVVFEDVGSPETQLLALDAVRPHGTVIMNGISTSPVTLNFLDKVQFREITIKGSLAVSRFWDRAHDYIIVASMIKAGKLQLDPLISHEFPLEKYEEAFKISDESSKSIKVLFNMT